MKEIVIPFTLTAAQVNTLDTVKTVVVTFSSDEYVRIPKRLLLKKAAGTAYAFTKTGGKNSFVVEGNTPESYSDGFDGGAIIQIVEVENSQTVDGSNLFGGRVVFNVPAEGFLDSALAKVRVALPSSNALVFEDYASDFVIRSTAGIASGTGGLEGWLVFEEYVPGA